MNECCEACNGSGKINDITCKYCGGVGWFDEEPYYDPYDQAYLYDDEPEDFCDCDDCLYSY